MVRTYQNNLYTATLRITGSKPLAEDILQNIFLKLWLNREKLPGITNFQAYLYTMAQHAIFDALRNIARQKENTLPAETAETGDTLPADNDTETNLQNKEFDAILHRAIESLPPKQKQTYILIKREGLKRHETAELLNVSAETVKFNLEQAVRKIQAFCKAHLSSFF